MSFTVVKSLQFPQKTLNYAYSSDHDTEDGENENYISLRSKLIYYSRTFCHRWDTFGY